MPIRERRKKSEQSAYADVQVELTRMVFAGLLPTIILGGVAMVGATGILSWHYKDAFLGWLSVWMTIACAARGVFTRLFLKRVGPEMSVRDANRWELQYGYLTFAYTCLLAISTIYNFAHHDYVARLWCVLGTSVFCAAFSSGLSLRPWLAQGPGIIMLLALGFSLLRSSEALVQGTTVLVLMYALQYRRSVTTNFHVIVAQIRTKRQLKNLAEHDALTGLANRRQFEAALSLACSQQGRSAILYIDLDRFKAVNDVYGHAVGDSLLQAVAGRLRPMVRGSDLIARLGGDEFAVLLAEPATEENARALAARINREIAEVFDFDGYCLQIGASVGVCMRTKEDTNPSALLSSADAALYEVKKVGRGGFSVTHAHSAVAGSALREMPELSRIAVSPFPVPS